MPADLYDDSEAEAPAPESTPNGSESPTSLLPLSFFEGKQVEPGSRCEVEVVRVHDDQAEVRYVTHNESSEPSQPPEAAEPAMGMEPDMME